MAASTPLLTCLAASTSARDRGPLAPCPRTRPLSGGTASGNLPAPAAHACHDADRVALLPGTSTATAGGTGPGYRRPDNQRRRSDRSVRQAIHTPRRLDAATGGRHDSGGATRSGPRSVARLVLTRLDATSTSPLPAKDCTGVMLDRSSVAAMSPLTALAAGRGELIPAAAATPGLHIRVEHSA
jgi:hypothetical protein